MRFRFATVLIIAALVGGNSWAQQRTTPTQKPPAGRSNLDPASRNKLATTLARTRFDPDSSKAVVEKEVVSGPSGKSCSTNIATTSNTSQQGVGSKYGSGNKEQVVVVQGPVINVCK